MSPIQAMVGINVSSAHDPTAEKISQIDSVDYTVMTTGRFDVLAEIVCRDTEQLIEVTNQIRDLGEVNHVEVMTYLRMVRQNYDWGTM